MIDRLSDSHSGNFRCTAETVISDGSVYSSVTGITTLQVIGELKAWSVLSLQEERLFMPKLVKAMHNFKLKVFCFSETGTGIGKKAL